MTVTYKFPGAVLTEREHAVPLDHGTPDGDQISVFSREVADPEGLDKPYLVFLQGGPGFEASPADDALRSAGSSARSRITAFCCSISAERVDQLRSTRSSPVTRRRSRPTYLTHFRADSIVRDAELIRQELGVDRWSVLGQSFGGFCSMTYLSIAPRGPARGVHHRRPVADRTSRRRRLRRDLPACARRNARTSSATRTTARASGTSSAGSKTRTSGCPPATG